MFYIAFEGASAFERLLLFRNAICFVSIKFHIIHLNFSVIFILLDIILVDLAIAKFLALLM